mmetsp:Transcript_7193/g.10037  ORF Transcript_7193/g.10037 Transcript_7193/m.10037 type:complete len:246 (-) Transcript_7193:1035-1772(-)
MQVLAFASSNPSVKFSRAVTLSFLLPDEPSLGLEQEGVAMVCIFAVLLQGSCLSLVARELSTSDLVLGGGVIHLHALVVKSVLEAALLLTQVVQLRRFLIRRRGRDEIALLLVLELRCQLEDLLILVILRLVALRQQALLIINSVAHEAALILRARNVVANALNLDLLLVERGLGVHDVAGYLTTLVRQVRIGTFHVLELLLKELGVVRLLLNLLLVILAHVADAVVKRTLALGDLMDAELELLV